MCKWVLHFHEIVDGRTPGYLREKLPRNRNNVLTLPNVFQELRCRTKRFANTFFPDAISSWNRIITNFESLPSYGQLKSHLLSLIRPNKKSTFGVHDPINLRHLLQLRIGLSNLRQHKKRHNFADTPSEMCLCETGIENTSHYILSCPFYARHREILTSRVIDILAQRRLTAPISVVLYLYGHPSLEDTENAQILIATLSYIKSSNRFSN